MASHRTIPSISSAVSASLQIRPRLLPRIPIAAVCSRASSTPAKEIHTNARPKLHTFTSTQQRHLTQSSTITTSDSLPSSSITTVTQADPQATTATATATTTTTTPPNPIVPTPTTPLSQSLLSTLPLLHLQSQSPTSAGLYATIHIHARPYLVTLGDRLRLPFLMPRVQPGDVLRLTHASTLGTRDYTLRGAPWVDARVFEARATVGSVESEPMRIMEKTKRRVRKVKTVRSKHRYTELLISELRVRSLSEVLGSEGDGLASD